MDLSFPNVYNKDIHLRFIKKFSSSILMVLTITINTAECRLSLVYELEIIFLIKYLHNIISNGL